MLYAYWKTKNLLLHDVLSLSGNGKHCILTDDYKSFATHHQHCVFQDILVGNHSFFLLLSAPCTSPPWSCLWWDATARSQHAHSSPAQHCSPAGMVLNILKIQRGLSHPPHFCPFAFIIPLTQDASKALCIHTNRTFPSCPSWNPTPPRRYPWPSNSH